MKRYEFQFEPFPNSPLIGLYINQCESNFDDNIWHPTIKVELGFYFLKLTLFILNLNHKISLYYYYLIISGIYNY